MGDLFSTAGKTSLLSVIIYLKIDHFTVFVVTGEGEVTKSERQHTWGGKRSWNRLICFGDKWNSFNFRGSFSLFKRKKKKQRNFKTQLKISWLVKDTFAPRRSSNPPGLWPQANTLRTRREGWFGKKKRFIWSRPGKDPTLQFAPIIPRWNREKMVEVNWPEWIVLRCEPKLIQMEI